MAHWLEKDTRPYYRCSNCRIATSELTEVCPFCGEPMTNYMIILTKLLEKITDE